MHRLTLLLPVLLTVGLMACGSGEGGGALETLPPIRTTTTTTTTTTPVDDRIRVYTVKEGENLSMIARSFEVPLQILIDANKSRISDPNNVQPGVMLEIPPVVAVNELPTTIVTSTDDVP
jgi:LysM repeat protein